jgi:uncharacterized protein YbaP (TraB family)
MKRYPIRLLFFILFLCTSLLAFSQRNYPKTLLWRISGKNLQKPSYLFGTMHLKDARIFQFSDSLYHYLEKAEGYAMEIDPERTVELMIQSLSEPDTSVLLKEVMEKEEYKKAAANLEKQFGIPANQVTRKQAWLYKMGMGYGEKEKADDMDAPIDTYLFNIAKRQGKWVGGIEDVEDQFNILDELFNADDFNTKKQKGSSATEKLIQIYIAQDLNGIEKFMSGYDSTYIDEVLIRRNKKMSRRMDSLAHIRSHFFAVGAAHLPGKDGVIQLLNDLGYQVDPVISNKKVVPANYRYTAIDIPWKEVRNTEETFSVLMPGKAVDYKLYSELIKMKMYADLGTGLYYFVTSFQVPGNSISDSTLLKFAANYAKASKILKQESITVNNRKGIALSTINNGYHCQLKIFSEGNELVLMMVGSQKKALLSSADANKFFASLNIMPKATDGTWFKHEDKRKGYTVSFPGKPSASEELNQQMTRAEGADAWNVTNLTYLDPVSQVFYMFVTKEPKPGYFIESDEVLFDEVRQGFENNPDIELVKYERGITDSKYASLWMDGASKANGYNAKSYHVVRGNRNFSLMVIYNQSGADTTQIERYFKSLKLMDYEPTKWSRHSDSLNTFSSITPAPFKTSVMDSTTQVTFAVAFDETNGAPFYVYKQALSPYYWAANDSVLYQHMINGIKAYDDSVLLNKAVVIDGMKGQEYKLQLKSEAKNIRHGLLMLNGDTLYSLYTILPVNDVTGNSSDFVDNFKLSHHNKATSVFTNKAAKLLTDLSASDSAIFTGAQEVLQQVVFSRQDLPLLHQVMLKPLYDFDENGYDTHSLILEKVKELADTSTVAFIANNYRRVEREELKYPLLTLLASIKSQESYDLLGKLLKTSAPVKGNPGVLGYRLLDSLLLTKSIIPQLLPLFADTILANELPLVVNQLIDSNMLEVSAVLPFQQTILNECKRLQTRFVEADAVYPWQASEWITLLEKLNTKESVALIKQIAKLPYTYIQYDAVLAILAINQVLEASVLQKLAADKYYRVELYNALKEKNKLSLFPAAYANQKSIAQSLLTTYASEDDYTPDRVDFLMIKQASYKGKQATFYLYKVVYNTEEGEAESYLGIVGPLDSKGGIQSKADIISVSGDPLDNKLINKQFTDLLQQANQ